MIKSILEVIYKFIRGTIRFISFIFFGLIAKVIWMTERKTKNVTKRKIRRVRFLSKIKLALLKYAPHFVSFMGWKPYFESLKRRLGDEL